MAYIVMARADLNVAHGAAHRALLDAAPSALAVGRPRNKKKDRRSGDAKVNRHRRHYVGDGAGDTGLDGCQHSLRQSQKPHAKALCQSLMPKPYAIALRQSPMSKPDVSALVKA